MVQIPGGDRGTKVLTSSAKNSMDKETSSHGGKYRYRRKGLLDSILHINYVGGVIVVSNVNADKLIQFLKYYSELFVRDVILLPEDEAILSRAVSIYYFCPKAQLWSRYK